MEGIIRIQELANILREGGLYVLRRDTRATSHLDFYAVQGQGIIKLNRPIRIIKEAGSVDSAEALVAKYTDERGIVDWDRIDGSFVVRACGMDPVLSVMLGVSEALIKGGLLESWDQEWRSL